MQRNYADALKMYTVSLGMKRRLFGSDHPSISDTLGNIALVHYKQGNIYIYISLFSVQNVMLLMSVRIACWLGTLFVVHF